MKRHDIYPGPLGGNSIGKGTSGDCAIFDDYELTRLRAVEKAAREVAINAVSNKLTAWDGWELVQTQFVEALRAALGKEG
jgi:hypothetical protein